MKGSERFCARNFNAQKFTALRLEPADKLRLGL